MPSKYAPAAPQNRTPAPTAPLNRTASSAPGPIKTLRLGRIKAAVWENAVEGRTFYNVTFARSYLDEQKKWHDSETFGRDDLLVLSKLADQAHTFIHERMAAQRTEDGS